MWGEGSQISGPRGIPLSGLRGFWALGGTVPRAHTHTRSMGGWSRRRARDRSALAPSRKPSRLQRRREPPRPRGDPGSLAAGARPPPRSLTSGSSGTSSMSGQGSLSWASGIAPPPGRPRSSGCPGRAASRVPGSPALRPRAPSSPRPPARPPRSGWAVRRRCRRGTRTSAPSVTRRRRAHWLPERGAGPSKPRPSPRGAAFPERTPAPGARDCWPRLRREPLPGALLRLEEAFPTPPSQTLSYPRGPPRGHRCPLICSGGITPQIFLLPPAGGKPLFP